jgi:hypothetical protein
MGMLPPFLINNSKGEFIIVFTIIFLIFLFIFCIFFYIKWILSWSFLFIKIIQKLTFTGIANANSTDARI